jgi:putative lipoprotein (rSAM/lipoprotein system)
MRTIFRNKKQKLLRKIYGGLSLTTALFVFQACYGTNKDFGNDIKISGTVTSKLTNVPIQGIRVTVQDQYGSSYTDNLGQFVIYTPTASEYKVKFEDIDGTENGKYLLKDSTVEIMETTKILNVSLDAQ